MTLNHHKKFYLFLIILMLILVLGGCTGKENSKDSRGALIKTTNPAPIVIGKNTDNKEEFIKNVEHDIESLSEVYDVAVIKGKKETLVVYKVRHLQRFRMKQIEKQINQKLEKNYPDENFTVSSDYKIFLEAVKLREDMKNYNYPDKKAQDRLKKIISLQKEMT